MPNQLQNQREKIKELSKIKEKNDALTAMRYFTQQGLNRAAFINMFTFFGFFPKLFKSLTKLPIINIVADPIANIFTLIKLWLSKKSLAQKIFGTVVIVTLTLVIGAALLVPIFVVKAAVATPFLFTGATLVGAVLSAMSYKASRDHYYKTPWVKGDPEEKLSVRTKGLNTTYIGVFAAAVPVLFFAGPALVAISSFIVPVIVGAILVFTAVVVARNIYSAVKKRELQKTSAIKAVLENEDPDVILGVDSEAIKQDLNLSAKEKEKKLDEVYHAAYENKIHQLLGIDQNLAEKEKAKALAEKKAILTKAIAGDKAAINSIGKLDSIKDLTIENKVEYLNKQLRLVEEAHVRATKLYRNTLYHTYKSLHVIAEDKDFDAYEIMGIEKKVPSWFSTTRLGMWWQYRGQKKVLQGENLEKLEAAYEILKKKDTREYYLTVKTAREFSDLGQSLELLLGSGEIEQAYAAQLKRRLKKEEHFKTYQAYTILKNKENKKVFYDTQAKLKLKNELKDFNENSFAHFYKVLGINILDVKLSEDNAQEKIREKFQDITLKFLSEENKAYADKMHYEKQKIAFKALSENDSYLKALKDKFIKLIKTGIDPSNLFLNPFDKQRYDEIKQLFLDKGPPNDNEQQKSLYSLFVHEELNSKLNPELKKDRNFNLNDEKNTTLNQWINNNSVAKEAYDAVNYFVSNNLSPFSESGISKKQWDEINKKNNFEHQKLNEIYKRAMRSDRIKYAFAILSDVSLMQLYRRLVKNKVLSDLAVKDSPNPITTLFSVEKNENLKHEDLKSLKKESLEQETQKKAFSKLNNPVAFHKYFKENTKRNNEKEDQEKERKQGDQEKERKQGDQEKERKQGDFFKQPKILPYFESADVCLNRINNSLN